MLKFLTSCLSGFTAMTLVGCGPKSQGPIVPSAFQSATSQDATPVTKDPVAPDTSSPLDARVAHRLAALPQDLQNKVKECEASKKFYDLGTFACSEEIVLADITCSIDQAFKSLLDPTTYVRFDTYLKDDVPTHRLYACTSDPKDPKNYTLHFYKFEQNIVKDKKLIIEKKAT